MQKGHNLLHDKIFRSLLGWNFMEFNGGRRKNQFLDKYVAVK